VVLKSQKQASYKLDFVQFQYCYENGLMLIFPIGKCHDKPGYIWRYQDSGVLCVSVSILSTLPVFQS